MQASILALSTAVPQYAFSQDEIVDKTIQYLSVDTETSARLKHLYANSAIACRHSVVPDFKKNRENWDFWGKNFPHQTPSTKQRNVLYMQEAPKLAAEAALKALRAWGGNPSALTHIISVSCTGLVAPGLEFTLMQQLQLNPSIQRFGINFMGCFGAFKGLSLAKSFARENPHHRILVVCTELCSLHFQTNLTPDNILGNSIFADGAAAVIVGCQPQENETSLWTIEHTASFALQDSLQQMSWDIGDHGFNMRLSHKVPVLLGRHITPFIDDLIGSRFTRDECNWAIHPGGKSIIQAIEKALQLPSGHAEEAWAVLSAYGNMSSATILFVLEKILEGKSQKQWTLGVGFGPGLSIEGFILRR